VVLVYGQHLFFDNLAGFIILLEAMNKEDYMVQNIGKDLMIQYQQPPKPLRGDTFMGLVGVSESMQRVFEKVRLYALSEAPVLILGETGAGKEGIASAIHCLSKRANGPFVTMNCSAITDSLFETELFGHEKGAFTGAARAHKGRFERANRGSLFLDELGDLSGLSQAKLLRALETSQIERVGGESVVKVDVRVVAATNHNLEKRAHDGDFRADLFYRLNALQIVVPPLRERVEDIEPLIWHFIEVLNEKYGRKVNCLTKDAVQLLKQYQWPGNVRELRNLMERLFAETMTEVIGLRSLKEWYEERVAVAQQVAQRAATPSYRDVVIPPDRSAIVLGDKEPAEMTLESMKLAFAAAGGNITKASQRLGVHKTTFYRAMKGFGVSRADLIAGHE
jgi:transcriptional regulator with PAS, ATPase and Fis domain